MDGLDAVIGLPCDFSFHLSILSFIFHEFFMLLFTVIFDQAWVFATSARSFQECAVEWSARRSSSGNAGGGEPIVADQRGSKEPPIVAEGQSAEGLSELSVTRAALWRERCSAKWGITVGRTGGRRRGAISDTFMGVFDSFLVAFGPNFGRIWQDEGGSRSAPQGIEQR